MNSSSPIACSLTADELPKRLEEISAVGKDALLSVSVDGALRFRADGTTRRRLEAIIAAESLCCPFLSFDLREYAGALFVTIDAADGGERLARDLVDAFVSEAKAAR